MVRLASALVAISTLLIPLIAADPKVVGFDFTKERVNARDVPSRLGRRAQTVNADLSNELLLYFINVTVGTPGQPFSLQLDTGSSDIWFPAVNSDICQYSQEECLYGSYNYMDSRTYADPGLPEFEIEYVDGSQIAGAYISDVLNIGSTKLTNMTMAAALQASRGIGIMGIGYQKGEAAVALEGFSYPNVIEVLQSEGHINTLAYSLYLNDLDANTGSILFGGVDSDKYTGDLIAVPVQIDSYSGGISSFTVAWTGLTVTGGGKTSNLSPPTAQPAILDCGTTDLLLPDAIANAIYNGVGVITNQNFGNVVKCSIANDDLNFAFQFGGPNGPIVKVPLNEFVTPLLTTDGSTPTFEDGSDACTFAIDSAGAGPLLFGDVFLRSAYVVYDLSSNVIALGQTNFDHLGSSNVKAISGSSIPGVSRTETAVTVQQTKSKTIESATSEAISATGIVGTSRSATFALTVTPTGSSGPASSNGRPLAVQRTTVLAGLVLWGGFVFGGVLMIWL